MAFTLNAAQASSSRSVIATFSIAPKFGSPIDATSVTNPALWSCVNAETGKAMRVLAVRATATATKVEVVFQSGWDKPLSQYVLSVGAAMQSSTNVTVSGTLFKTIYGSFWSPAQVSPEDLRDIRNPATPNNVSGHLVVGSDGDYAKEGGIDLVKKLIIRRIITAVNGFRHLVTYGAGIRTSDFYTDSDLIKLKAAVETQIVLEPEVAEVAVQVTLAANHVITVRIKARLRKSNQLVDVSLPITQDLIAA